MSSQNKILSKGKIRRIPTWDEIGKMLIYRGWLLTEREKNKIIYQRGKERIIAVRILGNKWKSEYFIGTRLSDSTGVQNETYAKILTIELGVNK